MTQITENFKNYLPEPEADVIRRNLQGIFRTNYGPFIKGEVNPQHLITLKYEIGTTANIQLPAEAGKIIIPRGNLDGLFLDVFRKDLDRSINPVSFKGYATFFPDVSIPDEFKIITGQRFWQIKTLYKLAGPPRSMVVQFLLYNPIAKDNQAPRFESWIGEMNKTSSALDEDLYFNSSGIITIPKS